MDINKMTREQFEKLPARRWDEEVLCESIIILPDLSEEKHDSGYCFMDFVAIKDGKAVCRLSGGSDVLHINGIGGYGLWDVNSGIPSTIPPIGWSLDCLPESGLLRIWPGSGHSLKVGPALSSFEIYAVKKEK